MAFGAARQSLDRAIGAQIGLGQSFVFVQGKLWMVKGDVNATHAPFFPKHIIGLDKMVQGSPFVFINGIPVCRQGHLAACGHPTTGSNFLFVET
ncbi:MAG: PAAR domain-containing protein [Bacteroidota bacterium]